MAKDRTAEIKKLWESTPEFVIEAGLSGNHEVLIAKAIECMEWVGNFQLYYKGEFKPFEGLGAIVDPLTQTKDLIKEAN